MNIDGVVETGADERPIVPAVVLAKRSGHKIGVNPYVQKFVYHPRMNDADEISFTVDKFWNGKLNPMWDQVKTFRLVYIPHYDSWFQIEVTMDDDDAVTKSVTGTHLQEAELAQLNVYLNINDDVDMLKDDYKPTKFYSETDKAHSLLDRLLADKANYYTIFHVDQSLYEDQREYTFDGKSIKDALSDIANEVDCLFVFGESNADDGKIHRTISAYDLEDYCEDCGERGNFPDGKCTKCGSTNIKPGYGHDTTIYIDKDNLADSITYETNADKVKNCFHLEAGDDAMTAAVRNCNPDGSNYLWYLSDAMKAEMSDELQEKLKQYDNTYNTVVEKNSTALVTDDQIKKYNEEVDKYLPLNKDLVKIDYPIVGHTALINAEYLVLQLYDYLKTTMMPNTPETQATTAQEQVAILQASDMSPVGVTNVKTLSAKFAEYALKEHCALYVDTALYKVTVNTTSFDKDAKTWKGTFTLTSYVTAERKQDQDEATTGPMTITFSDATPDYVKTKIENQLSRYKTNGLGVVALFSKTNDDFAKALKDYSLDNLSMLASVDQTVLDILTDLGFGGDDEKNKKWHDEYYTPYYNKLGLINDEIDRRTAETVWLKKDDGRTDQNDGLFDILEKERSRIRNSLDLRTFLGDDLWAELNSFRRDDEYHNENFVSDNLNQHEIIENAMKFYEEARKEIVKSATLQHTISADLYDLLIMPEFYPILDNFKLGNWIRVGIDGEVYKLRLIGYEVDFDDISKLQIDFSDVVNGLGTVEDLQSILQQASSMATTYSAVTRKANRGNQANSLISGMVENGLDLTNRKIVNSADSQEVVQDEHGMLFRTRNEYGTGYNNEQTKIINSGLYFTNDNWETVKTGVGHFDYYDPEDQTYKDGYGVIADTLVGNLILGNGIGIYNTSNSFKADENGVTVTGEEGADKSQMIFRIRRKNNDGTYTDYFTVNKAGDLSITGSSIKMTGGQTLERYVDDKVKGTLSSLNVLLSDEFYAVTTDADGSGGDFTNCYCTVTVLLGGEDISESADVVYQVTASQGIVGTWDLTSKTYTATDMSADSGDVTFKITYQSKYEITRKFNIRKIKQAIDGVVYDLYPSTSTIVKQNDGTLEPESITATAQKRSGEHEPVPYSGRYKVEETVDGKQWVEKYSSTANEMEMLAYTPTATAKQIRISLYRPDGTLLATRTVPIMAQGGTGYSVFLDNDSHIFEGNDLGAIKDQTVTVKPIVYKGSDPTAVEVTGFGKLPDGISGAITEDKTGVTFTISKADTVNGNGTITIQFTADEQEFEKLFSYSVVATGESPTLYSLEPSTVVIRRDVDGNYNPETIRFSAYSIMPGSDNGQEKMAYNGRFAIYENIDGVLPLHKAILTEGNSFILAENGQRVNPQLVTSNPMLKYYTYFSEQDESMHEYTPSSEARSITCLLYPSGTTKENSAYYSILGSQTALVARDGAIGYTVFLDNESYVFIGDEVAALKGGTVTVGPIVYDRDTQKDAEITGVFGIPDGLKAKVSDDKKSVTFTVSEDGVLKTSGEISISFKIDNYAFVKKFSYSVALKGQVGMGYSLDVTSPTARIDYRGVCTPSDVTFSAFKVTNNEKSVCDNCLIALWTSVDGNSWTYQTGKIASTLTYTFPNKPKERMIRARLILASSASGITDTSKIADLDFLDETTTTLIPVTITSNKTQYYLSTSKTALQGGEWSDTVPEYNPYTEKALDDHGNVDKSKITKYYWQHTITTYDDGAVVTSDAVLADDLNTMLKTTDNYDIALDQQAMLAKLSQGQDGVFVSDTDGSLYINATYIKTQSLSAATISAKQVISGRLRSTNEDSYFDLDTGEASFKNLTIDANNFNLTVSGGQNKSFSDYIGEQIPDNKMTGNEIVTAINATDTTMTIQAQHLDFNGYTIALTANNITISSTNFSVNADGSITATNADISGTITASSGRIGGFTIGLNQLTATNVGLGSSSSYGAYAFWAGSDSPSYANFSVKNNGDFYATSGQIANFTIDGNGLSGGSISGSTITGSSFRSPASTYYSSEGYYAVDSNGFGYVSTYGHGFSDYIRCDGQGWHINELYAGTLSVNGKSFTPVYDYVQSGTSYHYYSTSKSDPGTSWHRYYEKQIAFYAFQA